MRLLQLLAVAVAGWAACADGRVLRQTRVGLDLILGVQPEGKWDYGGRHITIARVTGPSRDAVVAVVRNCSGKLADAATKQVGWVMKGPPSNCLGHMNAGATFCKDATPWDLSDDGYGPTPTIAIASDMLDAYAKCLADLKTGSTGVSISLKGPIYSSKHTVWHSALYNTANGPAELTGFVSRKDKWVPFLNSRFVATPSCPDTLSPKGFPGVVGQRCWHWTAVV